MHLPLFCALSSDRTAARISQNCPAAVNAKYTKVESDTEQHRILDSLSCNLYLGHFAITIT